MPAVKPLGIKENDAYDFEEEIRHRGKLLHMEIKDIARRASITQPTLYRKLKNPDLFTRAELQRLAKTLNISKEERGILL